MATTFRSGFIVKVYVIKSDMNMNTQWYLFIVYNNKTATTIKWAQNQNWCFHWNFVVNWPKRPYTKLKITISIVFGEIKGIDKNAK